MLSTSFLWAAFSDNSFPTLVWVSNRIPHFSWLLFLAINILASPLMLNTVTDFSAMSLLMEGHLDTRMLLARRWRDEDFSVLLPYTCPQEGGAVA